MSMVERVAMSDHYSARVVSSARGLRPARIRASRSRWVVGNAFIVLCAILMALVFSVRSSESASANWFSDAIEDVFCTDTAFFNQPQSWSNGLMAMGAMSAQVGNGIGMLSSGDGELLNTRHTAYKRYGMSGTNWTVYRGETKDQISDRSGVGVSDEDADLRVNGRTCWPIGEVMVTYMANAMFGTTKFITSIASWLFSQAYEPSWLNTINDKVAEVISGPGGKGGLKDALYFPFLSLIVLMGALYLGWIGLVKKKSMEAGTSALWMFGCVLVGSVLMFNPALVPSMANSIVHEVSQAILVGTAGATTGTSTDKGNLCYAPVPATSDVNAKRSQIISTAECSFWVTFVYTPWAVGQFGVPPSELSGNIGKSDVTQAPAITLGPGGDDKISNWALYQLDSQSMDLYALSQDNLAQINQKQDNWFKVVDAVGSPDGKTALFNTWRGSTSAGWDRLQVAAASVVASGAGLVVIAVLAITMLAYGLGTSILSFFSVIFLLLGAHPGIGRRLALRWAEMYVGTIFKRIITAAMLGMVLTFYGVILSTATENWLASVMAIIALSVAVMIYRKTIMNAVGEVNFGGSGINDNEAKRAGERMQGMAGGAILGGVASLAGAGAVAKAAGANPALNSKVRRVGAAVTAGAATTAKGMGRGAVRGAFGRQSGMGQVYAVRDAASRARAEASKANAELDKQKRIDLAAVDTPEEWTAFKRKMDNNANQYERDWTANKDDPRWQKLFQDKYGFAAPDASTTRFAGYNMSPREMRDNWKYARPMGKDENPFPAPGPGEPGGGRGGAPTGGGAPTAPGGNDQTPGGPTRRSTRPGARPEGRPEGRPAGPAPRPAPGTGNGNPTGRTGNNPRGGGNNPGSPGGRNTNRPKPGGGGDPLPPRPSR